MMDYKTTDGHAHHIGWLTVLKQKAYELFESLHITWPLLWELAIIFVAGSVVGYVLKKMGKYLLIIGLCVAAILFLGEYLHVITIEWDVVRESIGLSPSITFKDLFSQLFSLVKKNIFQWASGFLGCIIGYKFG
jgi:uncharacterized membrane protein (Fun14 family)